MPFYRKACKVGISLLRLWVYKHGSFKMWFSWLWIFPPYIIGRDKTVEKCTDRDIGMPSNKDSHPRLLQNQFSTFVNFLLNYTDHPSRFKNIPFCDIYQLVIYIFCDGPRLMREDYRLWSYGYPIWHQTSLNLLLRSVLWCCRKCPIRDRITFTWIIDYGRRGSLFKTWPWVKLAPPVSVCLVVQAFDMKTCVCQACVSPIT